MKRVLSPLLATAVVVALVGAGCAPEDPQQRAARQAAQQHVSGRGGYTGEAHCTDSARTGWFAKRFTEKYVCTVRRDDGGCDWVSVRFDRETRRVTAQLDRRDAGCTLPA